MKLKKFLTGLMAVSMMTTAAVGLSGCGDKQEGASGDVDVIKIWQSEGATDAFWAEQTQIFNDTIGKEKGIKLDRTLVRDSQMVDVSAQNDDLPEFVAVSYAKARELVGKGQLVAIEDIEGGKEYLAKHKSPGKEGEQVYDGKVYTVMMKKTTGGLIYNKDLFKQVGMVDENGEARPPKTEDELVETAKKINALGDDIYGYGYPLGDDPSGWMTVDMPMTAGYGPNTVREGDTSNIDYTGMKNKFNLILRLKDEGCMMPGADSLKNDTMRAYFAEGKIGMFGGMMWDVGVLTTQFPAKCDWAVAPFPTKDGSEEYDSYFGYGGSLMMSNKVKNHDPEKIMTVLEWLTSDEMKIKLYEANLEVPYESELLEKADSSNIIPQFKQFAELTPAHPKVADTYKFTIENNDGLSFTKVWAGEYDLDYFINESQKRNKEFFEKAKADGSLTVEKWYEWEDLEKMMD